MIHSQDLIFSQYSKEITENFNEWVFNQSNNLIDDLSARVESQNNSLDENHQKSEKVMEVNKTGPGENNANEIKFSDENRLISSFSPLKKQYVTEIFENMRKTPKVDENVYQSDCSEILQVNDYLGYTFG